MQIDKTTLYDLSVFHSEEEFSLFHKIDLTKTLSGKKVLQKICAHPLIDVSSILEMQETLAMVGGELDRWPTGITNGTIFVIEKFLDDNPESIPERPDAFRSILYKFINRTDYAMLFFSMQQLLAFIRGFHDINILFAGKKMPSPLRRIIQESEHLLNDRLLSGLLDHDQVESMHTWELLHYARVFHVELPPTLRKLLELHAQLDAWYALASANRKLDLHTPTFTDGAEPYLEIKSLRHLLLEKPVAYDILLDPSKNFIFLTGANMAGKSTLIKALGLSVYMAHLGMGVPASAMQLTTFDGLLSNINVADNLAKGESYFYNEVRRVKETLEKLEYKKKWLVLIDELFKGTNIQDAMKCTIAVVEGLSNIRHGLFILSSHLYEIGEDLQRLPSLCFKYFETTLQDNELHFSYQLKEGISKDRMGYLILQKEGVTELLARIGQ